MRARGSQPSMVSVRASRAGAEVSAEGEGFPLAPRCWPCDIPSSLSGEGAAEERVLSGWPGFSRGRILPCIDLRTSCLFPDRRLLGALLSRVEVEVVLTVRWEEDVGGELEGVFGGALEGVFGGR